MEKIVEISDAAEQWRDIVGYEGLYQVSDMGRVKSLFRYVRSRGGSLRPVAAKILSATSTDPKGTGVNGGHLQVTLYKNGKKISHKVHLLVLTHFVGPRPDGMVACHNKNNIYNNAVTNLRWDTQANNIQDQIREGTHKEIKKEGCPRGHAYDKTYANGHRYCQECKYINKAARKAQS